MSSPSKPVNINNRPVAFDSDSTTPSGTPDIRALRAQYSGTPPVPNIPARYTPLLGSYPNATRYGSPNTGFSANELITRDRTTSGAINAKRPTSSAASGGAADNNIVDLDDLPAEDKARVLRRHLLLHGERPSRTDLRSSEGSDQGVPDPDETSAESSTPTRPGREISEAFPIQYHVPGADVTHDIYKWHADQRRQSTRPRSASYAGSVAPPNPAFEHIHEPGGFRRNYVLLQSNDQDVNERRATSNFIDFLYIYGQFAGEDLEEDEDRAEDEETAEETIPSTVPTTSETQPLLKSTGRSRSRSRRRAASISAHGDASVPQAVLMLLKSFVGTGVLFLGKGFANGGLLFSAITIAVVALISLYSFLLLVEAKFVVSGSFGDIGGALYGPWMRYAILFSIAVSQIGFVTAYTIFVAENLQAFASAVTNCTSDLPILFFILIQLVAFLPLALVRNLAKLSTTALIADAFILAGLIYIFGSELSIIRDRGIQQIQLFNPRDFPLFIGTAVFSFEGVGLVIPITDAMREPHKFPKALTGVMLGTLVLFGGAGALAYLTFGSDVKAVVLVNLDQTSKFTQAVQFLYSVAILLSIPLQFFPAVRILENGLFVRSGKRDPRVKWLKNFFRFGLVMVCTVISWAGAGDLDKFVALIGSFACVPLCFVYPAMLHYKAAAKTRIQKIIDILLCIFGMAAMIFTTAQTLKLMAEPEPAPSPRSNANRPGDNEARNKVRSSQTLRTEATMEIVSIPPPGESRLFCIMSVSTTDSSPNQPRVRRKPAPSLDLVARYPTPDPTDPFAPLSVLRSRTASTLSNAGAPLSFRGESTSHLPSLPYTGGRYPPDIYQAYLNLETPAPAGDVAVVTASCTRSTSNLSPTVSGYESDEPIWRPQDRNQEGSRYIPIQRRRSRSAVSRGEARLLSIPPKNSPYGHSKLQSYVVTSALSSTPALQFTAEPVSISPTSSIGQSSESVHSIMTRVQSDTGCPGPTPSSPLRLAAFSADDPVAPSNNVKAKKFARLLPKKIGSRLALTHQSTDNLALSQTNPSFTSFPHLSNERPSKSKHISEENTFHCASQVDDAFPGRDSHSSTHHGRLKRPDAEFGCIRAHGTSTPSHSSHASYSTPPATSATPTHFRSLTALDGRGLGPTLHCPTRSEISRPSTAQSISHPTFDENALPTPRQLSEASSCVVIAENGLRVPFGEIFRDQKTIVIFIRHFWCPLCQDYMFSVTDNVDPKMLKETDVNLVVIGNGSFNMIKSYRQIFRTQFTFYTDPSLRLHKALGMTLRVMEPKAQRKRGGYVRHGPMAGIAMVFKNALRVGMPVWEKGGDISQLGGEFVLGPGMTATYAHRMPNPRSHAPIMHVLSAAGICLQCEKPAPMTGTIARATVPVLDEDQWMEERRLSLSRIRERKIARRMGVAFPCTNEADEHQVVLPKIDPPGKLTRSDSIEEEEEEDKNKEEDEQDVRAVSEPIVGTTQSSTCELEHENVHCQTASETTDDGEAETSTVGSHTLSESDSSSDRTRTEEVEPHTLRDKVTILDLEDPGIPEDVSL
ncbi:transmembrane amino acid transporter protein-domain-containing protein [Chiua virens]|nr:transmembrane amino acid transporter protein-domain-containing protein [Chiua virens]